MIAQEIRARLITNNPIKTIIKAPSKTRPTPFRTAHFYYSADLTTSINLTRTSQFYQSLV